VAAAVGRRRQDGFSSTTYSLIFATNAVGMLIAGATLFVTIGGIGPVFPATMSIGQALARGGGTGRRAMSSWVPGDLVVTACSVSADVSGSSYPPADDTPPH
jgi:hypothetical protein